jgi:microcystin-dependent protein
VTLETTNVKHVYACDGTTIHWPFNFDIIDSTDVKVMVTDALSERSVIDPDLYTVDTSSGWVVYPKVGDALPGDGTTITIYRERPEVQESVFTDGGPFPAISIEGGLDSLTMMVQEVAEGLGRAIKYSIDQNPSEDDIKAIIQSSSEAAASAAAAVASAIAAAVSAAAAQAAAGGYIPIGGSMEWPSATPPSAIWHLHDGTAISRTTYAALFAVIGTTYGSGDGISTFNIPDSRDRMTIGAGNLYAAGSTGGEATHALSTAELAAHSHGVTDPQHGHSLSDPQHYHAIGAPGSGAYGLIRRSAAGEVVTAGSLDAGGSGVEPDVSTTPGGGATNTNSTGITLGSSATGISTQNAGSGTAHNNLPPYIGFYKMMRIS